MGVREDKRVPVTLGEIPGVPLEVPVGVPPRKVGVKDGVALSVKTEENVPREEELPVDVMEGNSGVGEEVVVVKNPGVKVARCKVVGVPPPKSAEGLD